MAVNNSTSEVSPEQVRAQCDRILASKGFSGSKRQSAFLKYVINSALEGKLDRLKEFTIGIEVFDKDETFDPNIDSIVRVEASRLRSKLSEYYVGEGQGDSIRISVPKGHYVPVFNVEDIPKVERSQRYRWQLWAGLVFFSTLIISSLIFFSYRIPFLEPNPAKNTSQLANKPSIAVLPLRDWSRLPEEYFSQAMTDAMISSLAEIGVLHVTSLTSVMKYKNTEVSIPEIGRELGVEYIVEGSVYRDGENVRITAQLIDTKTDKHVWSRAFERPMSDLLSVQSEVAAAIGAQISDEMSPASNSNPKRLNPAAYEAYMKGSFFYNQFTAEGFRRSISFFQDAINIEPNYAKAYAGLASCHCLLAGHGLELVSPVIAIPEARSLANKALSLNSEMSEPIAFLGIINFKYEWDYKGAEKMLNRAIKLNSSLFHAHIWYSQILEAMNRHDEAISRARFAKQLNPLSLAASLNLGWQLFQAEKYTEATAEIDKLIEFDPQFWGGHWAKGHIHNQHGSYKNAINAFRLAVEAGGGHSLPMSALGYTYAIAGMQDQAHQILTEMEALSKDVYVSPFHMATVYAGLNQADLMFEWLERAYQVRARSLAWLQVTREMKPFYDDNRFQNLLKRIGIYPNSEADNTSLI